MVSLLRCRSHQSLPPLSRCSNYRTQIRLDGVTWTGRPNTNTLNDIPVYDLWHKLLRDSRWATLQTLQMVVLCVSRSCTFKCLFFSSICCFGYLKQGATSWLTAESCSGLGGNSIPQSCHVQTQVLTDVSGAAKSNFIDVSVHYLSFFL